MRRRADSYQHMPPSSTSSPPMPLLQAQVQHPGPTRHDFPHASPFPPHSSGPPPLSQHEPHSVLYRQPVQSSSNAAASGAHRFPPPSIPQHAPPASSSSYHLARRPDYNPAGVARSASMTTYVPSGLPMAATESTQGEMYPPPLEAYWRDSDWPPTASPFPVSPTDERRDVRMQYGHSWPTSTQTGGSSGSGRASRPPMMMMMMPDRRPPQPDRYRPPYHQHSTSSSSSSSSSASSSVASHSTGLSTAASSSLHHPSGSHSHRHRHGKTLSLDRRAEASTLARVQPYHFPQPYARPVQPQQQSAYAIPIEQQQYHQHRHQQAPRQHHQLAAPPQHLYHQAQQELRQPPPRLSSPSFPPNSPRTLASPLSSPTGLTRARSYRSEVDREEANRQKSKRHYDRKKDQRNSLTELMAELIGELHRLQRTDSQASDTAITQEVTQAIEFRLPMPSELAQGSGSTSVPDEVIAMHIDPSSSSTTAATDSTSEADSTATPVKRANERKRLNKLMQRHLEMQRIQQLSHVARALEPMLRSTDVQDALRRSVMVARTAAEVTPIMSPDAGVRAVNTLFQPWLRCQDSWPHLLLAEERLSLMAGRPLARIVASLRTVLNGPVSDRDDLSQSASSTPKAVRRHG